MLSPFETELPTRAAHRPTKGDQNDPVIPSGRTFSEGQSVPPKSTAETLADKRGASVPIIKRSLARVMSEKPSRARIGPTTPALRCGKNPGLDEPAAWPDIQQAEAGEGCA